MVEDDDYVEEAEEMNLLALDKEITNTFIQQEAACIVIDDAQISLILKSNTDKKLKKNYFFLYLKKRFKNLSMKSDEILKNFRHV